VSKVYQFVRSKTNRHECCKLYLIEGGEQTRAVPLFIANEASGVIQNSLKTVAMTILLDYFEPEPDACVKAATLVNAVRNRLYKKSYWLWSLNQNELGSMIADILHYSPTSGPAA
jgi:hypothetical protein